MNDVMGVIHNGKHGSTLEELSQFRSLGAVPYGGRYRLIDFVLSNMVHSGVENVAIFPYTQYRSLMDHLGSGKEWDLDRKHDGLFILPPPTHANFLKSQNLSSFYQHLDYFQRSTQKYAILASSYVLCRIDFRRVLDAHLSQGADITLIYKRFADDNKDNDLQYDLDIDENGHVRKIISRVNNPHGKHTFLDMLIMERSLLIDCIKRSVTENAAHLVKDILIPRLGSFKIAAYEHTGYTAIINSLPSYFRHTMELLKPDILTELFYSDGSVFTKVKDEAPTRYKDEADVKGSLIANGCVIEGHVENSILFRGVRVKPGAVVKNSILMQKCEIASGAYVNHAILDKEVRVTAGMKLEGNEHDPEILGKRRVH
jgi:glucose-1-phosphate adenylyltransferase